MLYTLFKIVTYNDVINIDEDNDDDDNIGNVHISLLQNSLYIGKNLVNIYIRILYNKYHGDNSNITFSKFKEDFISQGKNNVLITDSFYLHLGGKLIQIMTTCNMLEIKVINYSDNSLAILRLTNEISKLLDRKIL